MNNPNPFVPKGSLLDQQNQRRSRLKLAVFCGLTLGVASLMALLIQGCNREKPTTDAGATPPDLSSNLQPATSPSLPPADTNVPAASPNPTSSIPPVATQPLPTVPPPANNPPVLPPAQPAPTPGSEYVVVQGDTLAKIAKAQGVSLKALEAANPGVDPKKLKLKQKLTIPGKSAEPTAAANPTVPGAGGATETAAATGTEAYAVKSGDTLAKIAKHHGVTLKALRAANPKFASTDHIHVGDKLVIPTKTEATPTTTATDGATATVPAPAPAPAVPAPTPTPTPAPGH